MNYQLIYNNLISFAIDRSSVSGYTEKHHIIPRSLGGSNRKDNLVVLTPREHFIAHLLLAKIHKGKMTIAAYLMSTKQEYTSKVYDTLRKQSIELRKGQIPWNKGIAGKPCTDEQKMLLSNYWLGKPKSESHAFNISKGKIGHTAGMTGKTHSEETKKKMSCSMKGARGSQQRIEQCPYCVDTNVSHRHIKFCKIKQGI